MQTLFPVFQDHMIYTHGMAVYLVMAILRIYRRNSIFVDLAELVEEISRLGLVDALQKYHNKPLEKEAKSIVAGPKFSQRTKQIISNPTISLETSYNLNLEIRANTICSL